jgi:DNA-binding MarR family transcriptional regulator
MSASVRERRGLQASVEGTDKALNGTASWRTHPGWEAVYAQYHGDVKTSPPDSPLTDGAVWKIDVSEDNPFMKTDETKPPKRFSESSIIQQMKKEGIGRPSTYVSIVKNLGNKGYVDVERNSLSPTEKGRTLWLQVVPFFNEQNEADGLFTPQFTSKMEESLDRIEHAKMSGANVWNDFLEEFRAIHNIALEEKRKVPTIRQLALLENRIPHLDEARREELLSGKKIGDLTGDEARRIIKSITDANAENGILPASDKQTALIVKLSDQSGMDLDESLLLVGSTDIAELTGGREGTASELISTLIEKSRNMPATPAQVDLVNKLADQHEMPISEVLAIVGLREIGEMTKSDASDIINEMKKRARRSGRRRSGA